MIILALDASENTATAALVDGKRLIAQTLVNSALTHSETLLPMTESLLSYSEMKFSDIDLFACAAGPGSFTGVRIAVSTAKGLAFGRNKPCAAISSLEALAYNLAGYDSIICPVMDARRDRLYNAVFSCRDGKITRLCEDRVIEASELASELEQKYAGQPIRFCGGGYDIAAKAIVGRANMIDVPYSERIQCGYSLALAAYTRYTEGELVTASDTELAPIYLRPAQAERERLEAEKAKNQ